MQTVAAWWMWAIFFAFVALVLSIDIFYLGGKKSRPMSTKAALGWTITWFMCAMVFNIFLYWYLAITVGRTTALDKSLQFFTGYLIEESLSVDNMFVFLMIFTYFSVPKKYQRRVLIYGLMGAVILRLIVILLGTWVVSKLHWILYVFGFFLLITGIRMLFFSNDQTDLKNNFLLCWLRNHLRITDEYHEEKFLIRRNNLIYFTPLFLVLVLIEVSDVIFALDSLPAIFAISNDPFIIFTSNIFAILGLRALYFLLVNAEARFYLLKYGIAIMLSFIGVKMLIAPWIKLPIPMTLSIVAAILATTIMLSLFLSPKTKLRNPND